jgi:hypothetical protein
MRRSSLTALAAWAALAGWSASEALANRPQPDLDSSGQHSFDIAQGQAPQPTPPAATPTPAPAPAPTPAPTSPPAADETAPPADEEATPGDEPSLGEVEEVKVVDLTEDSAKRAVDAYVLLKDKYKDAQLENYETLQDFVDKDAQGKAFEADVKAAGFPNVETWNTTITTVSNAYSNIVNDQSADINQQIEEVQKDAELAQDMKDRLTNSLKALIPTENNRKVAQALLDDAAYTEKLKQLETEDE